MAGHRRRELDGSVRLAVHSERWFLLDLLIAVVGFVALVAGTGLLAVNGGPKAGVPLTIEQGSTTTLAVLGGAAVLWILLPAVVATMRLRSRVTNTAGNVDSQYRFEQPGVLLGPPAVLVLIALIATVAAPLKWPAIAFGFVAGAYLLVRTVAFSYRVFAFSHPLVVYAGAFVTFALYALAGVVQLASIVDQQAMVADALAVVGVSADLSGSVGSGVLAFPLVLTVAMATPIVLVALYLAGQALAGAYVRRAEPTVDRGSLRAGQRNPFRPTTANGAGSTVQRQRRPSDAGGAQTAPAHIQTTRVYTPTDEEVADPASSESDPTTRNGQRCRTCGTSFGTGVEVRFCPNCGQRLDDG
ncbi:hypothetical protein BRC91_09120 [Halobacteriales archaeon QS_4_62_28]|nr:MAG: hypothetical protein BRC91_09120 [Halobacteriales archaeon QS_4_62_28]